MTSRKSTMTPLNPYKTSYSILRQPFSNRVFFRWLVLLVQGVLLLHRSSTFIYAMIVGYSLYSISIGMIGTFKIGIVFFTSCVCLNIAPYQTFERHYNKLCRKGTICIVLVCIAMSAHVVAWSVAINYALLPVEVEHLVKIFYFGWNIWASTIIACDSVLYLGQYAIFCYFCSTFLRRYLYLEGRLDQVNCEMGRIGKWNFLDVQHMTRQYFECQQLASRIADDYSSVFFVWIIGFLVEVVQSITWALLCLSKTLSFRYCHYLIILSYILAIIVAAEVSDGVDRARRRVWRTLQGGLLKDLASSGRQSEAARSVKLLVDIVRYDRFSMTGIGFFRVDRKFLSTMTGVLVTYGALAVQLTPSDESYAGKSNATRIEL